MSAVGQTERTLREYIEAGSCHDAEKLASFFADNGVMEDVAMGIMKHEKKEIKDFAKGDFVSHPDFTVEIKSLFVANNWAAIEILMLVTEAKTGRKLWVRGAIINELKEGKINRHTDYYDSAAVK